MQVSKKCLAKLYFCQIHINTHKFAKYTQSHRQYIIRWPFQGYRIRHGFSHHSLNSYINLHVSIPLTSVSLSPPTHTHTYRERERDRDRDRDRDREWVTTGLKLEVLCANKIVQCLWRFWWALAPKKKKWVLYFYLKCFLIKFDHYWVSW